MAVLISWVVWGLSLGIPLTCSGLCWLLLRPDQANSTGCSCTLFGTTKLQCLMLIIVFISLSLPPLSLPSLSPSLSLQNLSDAAPLNHHRHHPFPKSGFKISQSQLIHQPAHYNVKYFIPTYTLTFCNCDEVGDKSLQLDQVYITLHNTSVIYDTCHALPSGWILLTALSECSHDSAASLRVLSPLRHLSLYFQGPDKNGVILVCIYNVYIATL